MNGKGIAVICFLVVVFLAIIVNQGYTLKKALLATIVVLALSIYLVLTATLPNERSIYTKCAENETERIVRLVKDRGRVKPKSPNPKFSKVAKKKCNYYRKSKM